MRKIFFVLFIASFWSLQSLAQGCVAIRSNGGVCTMTGADGSHQPASWVLGINSRYFRSFRHFVGKDEQEQRQELGNEVINHTSATEFSLVHTMNNRWSVGLFAPIIANKRSSWYEHDNKNRYSTHSFGLGDIRTAAYFWTVDPAKNSKFNVQVGLGVKFPTGDYKYLDYFHKNDSVKILGPVDQSIQLGDGGTGITTEFNAYYHITKSFSAYANGYYLLNPREQNGVSTSRGSATPPANLVDGSDVMSVPDQYMVRAGASYKLQDWMFSAGMRMECVTVYDLLGGSNGFRRPGYVISAEPVVAYKLHKAQIYLSVPFAVERNRTQSVPNKIKTEKTGVYTHGDAAFADYSVNFGVSFALK
ncbi:MAG: hypothetical protein ACJ75F_02570 [Flavisolibacter sp.]